HIHRHDRDLHPDARRTVRQHAGDPIARILHRHPRLRSCGRCGDLHLPGAASGDRPVPRSARRASCGGDVVARRRVRAWVASISMRMGRIVFPVILAFPFYWMLITTFKRTTDLYNLKNNPFVFNESPTLEHLRLLFHETLFVRWALNTAFAGAIVVTITLLLALPAAYALVRLTGGWGAQLGIGVFLTY